MEILAPLAVNSSRHNIQVNESIMGLIYKAVFELTAENLHNLLAAQNVFLNMSIKSRGSVEKNICNSIPVLRLLQFGQNRKGYYNYMHQFVGGKQYIGLCGVIPLCETGSLKLRDGEYLEISSTNLPSGTILSMTGIEGNIYGDHYMQYERGGIPTNQPQASIPTNDLYDTILLSASQSIEREYNEPVNSYANPMQRIQMFYGIGDRPDTSYTGYDIMALNILQNGNDVVAMWSKTDIVEGARLKSTPVYPPFFPAINNTTDPNGFYSKQLIMGYDDFQLIDLEDVDKVVIYKNTDQDYPFFTERKIRI